MRLSTTGEVARDIRRKAGQAVSLATAECRALSGELGDFQGRMKQPENSSEDAGESRESMF